jgi:hypothetical protein
MAQQHRGPNAQRPSEREVIVIPTNVARGSVDSTEQTEIIKCRYRKRIPLRGTLTNFVPSHLCASSSAPHRSASPTRRDGVF